jgi:putative membrane protein
MTRALLAITAALTLAAAWLGLARATTAWPFTTHMAMHMAVVAIAAPLLALAVAGSSHDPVFRAPALFLAVPVSLLELVAVWGWHAPALHHLARHTTSGLIAEQATFFLTGTWVWLSALGGDARSGGTRAGAGLVALLLTSMHMTLLGALLALAPRALYGHALDDQHLGGAVMLVIGGAAYLAGGLNLAVALLRGHRFFAAKEPR